MAKSLKGAARQGVYTFDMRNGEKIYDKNYRVWINKPEQTLADFFTEEEAVQFAGTLYNMFLNCDIRVELAHSGEVLYKGIREHGEDMF